MNAPEPACAAGIWAPEHVWVTLGAVAMVFLAATQSLAVTTVMPPRQRALIAGALFGAEIDVPYLLIDHYGFDATGAGLGLTSAALLWAAGAEVQGRIGDRLGNARITLIGTTLLAAAALVAAATAATALPRRRRPATPRRGRAASSP
ncbi:hypothetical protein BOH66_10655 [Microbacterium aurum]|uniref:Major facilitator superfamily (MFS) profile domain-containing protein n=1 Tax=Microbacterium aurum TaxID=36805 RepID=A0A1P8U932_9MICO|nr:hypothetical protein BOH66_10655 [Microbacterium aurum]